MDRLLPALRTVVPPRHAHAADLPRLPAGEEGGTTVNPYPRTTAIRNAIPRLRFRSGRPFFLSPEEEALDRRIARKKLERRQS